MKERMIKILLGLSPSEAESRFAVELAHLIGFCSISREFPLVIDDLSQAEDGSDVYAVGCPALPADKRARVIPVAVEGEDSEKIWRELADQLMPKLPNAAARPADYVSATEHSRKKPEQVQGGLEQLFSEGWLLTDADGDGLPDREEVRFLLPAGVGRGLTAAACNLACRLGLETCGVRYPLVAEEDDGSTSLICFAADGDAPRIRLDAETPHKRITVVGRENELPRFTALLAERFPEAGEGRSLSELTAELQKSLSLQNADGQKAYLTAFGGDDDLPHGADAVLLSADADPEEFSRLWPKKRFRRYADSDLAETRSYDLVWELDRARTLLEEKVYPKLRPGDSVELRGALWQDEPTRRAFAEAFTEAVSGRGAAISRASIICAFKQGMSWLEEIFAPAAAAKGGVRRVIIRYSPHFRNAAMLGNDPVWQEINKQIDKPPRWLQNLYPADALVAGILGISSEDVCFEAYTEDPSVTYEAAAYDSVGICVHKDTYVARFHEQNYIEAMPELGPALPSAGFIHVLVNGQTLVNEKIETDCEAVWSVFQKEILPWLDAVAAEKDYDPARMPFFSRMELEVGIGGPERRFEPRSDLLSSGEMLAESLHQVGQQYFMYLGRRLGRNLDGPGLVLPIIHVRTAKPELTARLYLPCGEKPSFRPLPARVLLREVRGGETLSPVWEVQLPPEAEPLLPALADLSAKGETGLGRLLAGYGDMILRSEREEYAARLPEAAPVLQDLSIDQIDIPTDEVIGYDEYARIMEQLRRVPGLRVCEAGRSMQGRRIWTIAPASARRGYVSRVKMLRYFPSVLINGRHHANEVSATNAIFAFVRELLTDPAWRGVGDEMTMTIVPAENVDGVALHAALQKEHPWWQHHACYTNSVGADLMPHYYIPDTKVTEALVFQRVFRTRLPDVMLDLHGVPHHEMPQNFSQLKGYKGLWIPRALLCDFYFHIDDADFASNKALSQGWAKAVQRGFADWEHFTEINRAWSARFQKYSFGSTDDSFPSEWDGNLLNYWIPSPYHPRHPYPTVSAPWIMSLMYTAEAADETAHGACLADCAEAHLRHVRAGLHYLRSLRTVPEEGCTEAPDGGLLLRSMRHRPLLPPENQRN